MTPGPRTKRLIEVFKQVRKKVLQPPRRRAAPAAPLPASPLPIRSTRATSKGAVTVLEPNNMTEFQKIVTGLKIIQEYLSKKNPGDISAEHDEIWAGGVPDHAMGGNDRANLKAMGWEWSPSYLAWRYQL